MKRHRKFNWLDMVPKILHRMRYVSDGLYIHRMTTGETHDGHFVKISIENNMLFDSFWKRPCDFWG